MLGEGGSDSNVKKKILVSPLTCTPLPHPLQKKSATQRPVFKDIIWQVGNNRKPCEKCIQEEEHKKQD